MTEDQKQQIMSALDRARDALGAMVEILTSEGTEMYIPIKQSEIPDKVRFDVPRQNQGQIVEIAYGGFGRAEHSDDAPYKRITDQSEPVGSPERVRYFRLG